MDTKTCPRCKISYTLPVENFHVNNSRKDGLQVYCKPCSNAERRRYYTTPGVRERNAAAHIVWRNNNSDRMARIQHNRRALKLNNYVDRYTKQDVDELYKELQGRCAYCFIHMHRLDVQIEHIVPISKGGPDTLCNITLACKSCNTSKSDRPLREWLDV